MDGFAYRNGELLAEDVPVRLLADRYGTPLYIYSRNHFRSRFRELAEAMAEVRPLICYSMKANSNAAVLRTFLAEGAGVDIVSGGELYRALRAGADPARIVFAGVGKTREEIEYALRENILFFTVESEAEARRISGVAASMQVTARIAFRINPDVDPQTHQYISTGKKENKFGLNVERAREAYAMASSLPGIEIAGLHIHIGSQILTAQPFADALARVEPLCLDLKAAHPTLRYLDVGGGLGIRYEPDQQPLAPAVYAEAVLPALRRIGLSVLLEPGRSLVGNGGVLVCRVQYIKDNPFRKFIVADAAMNDLIRPALYQAYHEIVAVAETRETVLADLVGPICESGDFLAAERELPLVAEGDLLAVKSAGAYGFVMASTYNSRPLAAEIMVDGAEILVARERQASEDLVRGEWAPGLEGRE